MASSNKLGCLSINGEKESKLMKSALFAYLKTTLSSCLVLSAELKANIKQRFKNRPEKRGNKKRSPTISKKVTKKMNSLYLNVQ